jgi:hypothetical protein
MPEKFDIIKAAEHIWWAGSDKYHIYAILDSARDEAILAQITLSGVENRCLFEGQKGFDLAEVAPYVVPLKKNASFTDWLLGSGWAKSWGIFLRSDGSLKQMQRHFRYFTKVYDDELQPVYFRFYDPRVFRVYLPTCNEEELDAIFGPCWQLYAESEDGSSLIEYSLDKDGKLETRMHKNAG